MLVRARENPCPMFNPGKKLDPIRTHYFKKTMVHLLILPKCRDLPLL